MASIYTHNRFGLLLMDKLDSDLLNTINKYPNLYLLGQQGPDLFFFDIKKLGSKHNVGSFIHNQPGKEFFINQKELINYVGKDSPEVSYLIGSICHYILDVTIHPTVNRLVEDGYSHIDIESELDRYFMIKDQKNPFKFRLDKLINKDDNLYGRVVPKFYQTYGTSKKDIISGIKGFRIIKRFFYSPTIFKEKIIISILKKINKLEFSSLLIRQRAFEQAKNSNAELEVLFNKALNEASHLINQVFEYIYEDKELPEFFNLNYNGEK